MHFIFVTVLVITVNITIIITIIISTFLTLTLTVINFLPLCRQTSHLSGPTPVQQLAVLLH